MVSPASPAVSLLRLHQVLERTGRSRSLTYRLIARGLWPKGIALGARAVAWPSHEVDRLISATIMGWSEDRIRAEVRVLMQARAAADAGHQPTPGGEP